MRRMPSRVSAGWISPIFLLAALSGCSSGVGATARHGTGGGGNAGGTSSTGGSDLDASLTFDADFSDSGILGTQDPTTCAEANSFRTYLGCEYWPTVVGNVVKPSFDFAVIVANVSDGSADVTVTGPNAFSVSTTVPGNRLATIYLPWVASLKGPAVSDLCASSPFTASVLAPASAYHLVSSRPVVAYQFSPLEFFAAGGPPGKTWSACDAVRTQAPPQKCECNSFANDASLLLPTNALTGNYRAFTWKDTKQPPYIAITAVEDATEVNVKVGPAGALLAGPTGSGITAAVAGDVLTFTLNQGDVAELVAPAGKDLSGTLVQTTRVGDGGNAQKPIQVITGSSSAYVPDSTVPATDHLEEIAFPAEALGKDYVVPVPTGPGGQASEHVVRLYGHFDGTALQYFPSKPAGAPDALAAGDVVEIDTTADFQVQGSQPFGIGSFLIGGQKLGFKDQSGLNVGDPSQSLAIAIPQYRDRYVFLAPVDYPYNFVDIVASSTAGVAVDGKAPDASAKSEIVGRSADGSVARTFDVYRVKLDAGPQADGSHLVTATEPVGIQVVGYGAYTSYQYPGGLNLNLISAPPVFIK